MDVPDIETELTDAERAALDEHQSPTRAMLVDALLAQGVSAEDVERRFAALEEEARKASAREAAVRTAPATRDEPAAKEESKLVGPVVIAVIIACIAAAVCYQACR